MRAFIDLSLKYAPHEIIKGLQSVGLGGHISFNQWSTRLAFSQSMLCMTMGTSSWSEHIYLSFCLFFFPSWLKFFLIREENYLVCIRWFSSGAQIFQHSCKRVAYFADMFLKIKTFFLHNVIPEAQLFNETCKIFL